MIEWFPMDTRFLRMPFVVWSMFSVPKSWSFQNDSWNIVNTYYSYHYVCSCIENSTMIYNIRYTYDEKKKFIKSTWLIVLELLYISANPFCFICCNNYNIRQNNIATQKLLKKIENEQNTPPNSTKNRKKYVGKVRGH